MRLIDADALIKSIESDRNCSDMPSQWIDGVNYAIDLIELYEPTIDAVEVVRGEWIDYTCGSGCYCSNCGWDGDDIIDECIIQDFDFCPNCGARMKDKDIDVPYKIASDQRDYDSTYEPTYNEQDGSM